MIRKLVARLDRVPIRWRLALTSAALTLAILLLFALVIGAITTNRLQADFDDEVRLTAADLSDTIRVAPERGGLVVRDPDVVQAAETGGAKVRVVTPEGASVVGDEIDLGPPSEDPRDVGAYRVVSRPLRGPPLRGIPGPPGAEPQPLGYVQYAKPRSSVNDTIGRVRLFLLLGVVAGTGLALLAGLAVARRAMAPIADLTAAAKDVERTRDPGVTLPKPEARDEVADLARTLEEMLAALDAARGETEATLARQREFVADASHELRTPLTSVLANLELLAAELEDEQAEIAGSALRSSQRMRRLVGDLLLLARADAGRRSPRRPTDLAAVVREAAAEAAALAGEHELELVLPEDGEAMVSASADDLHRLVRNLIENAVTHTAPGTDVRVIVEGDRREIALTVEDDGPGIPADLRARLFDRFVRAPSGAQTDVAGSGLGLAIVHAVAVSHGGSVALADSDSGARFVVRLPAVAGAAAEAARPRPRPAAPSAGA